MEIITTHEMADFDALASLIAAKKLYPKAHLVLPGSQEKQVRDYLKESPFALELIPANKVKPEEVSLMVVVDTKLKERIGPLGKVVELGKAKLHVYDHHPSHPKDLQGDLEVVRETGAATTILVKILRDRGIKISPEEATLFTLGIYEDTGCFTFNSTTPEDLEAAAYLLACGAELNTVSDYVKRELTPEQVDMLNEMIKNAEEHNFNGVDVVITSISRERYVGDLAVLAHKFKDMKNLNVLFVLARMDDRITLIARSRIPLVNVGEIAEEFGGGGHPSAASAMIKDMTLVQAKELLIETLNAHLSKVHTASSVMVVPVLWIAPHAPIKEVEQMMVRYNINAMPVLENEDGKLLGVITRQTVEKALYHGLGEAPVEDYMSTDIESVDPQTPLTEVERVMMEKNQRIVPVVEDDKVVGIVSRGDVLRVLYRELSYSPQPLKESASSFPFVKNVRSILRDRLPDYCNNILKEAGDVANEMGVNVYVVGGFVRDLLLRVDNLDIDLVVEGGDGIVFAHHLASRFGGRVNAHKKFHTAVVVLPDGFKIDVATARMEYYEEPAALPVVKMGSIKRDLYRRDFSINAMAIKLNGENAFHLIDFFGGQKDLKEKRIRVLHNLSFVEDPTRAFRAIRFEQRYGFRIGKQTERLIKIAIKENCFEALSKHRLFTELRLMLSEREPWSMVKRMDQLGLLKFVHPRLRITSSLEELFEELDDVVAWYSLLFLEETIEPWILYLAALFSHLKAVEVKGALTELGLPRHHLRQIFRIHVTAPRLVKVLEEHDVEDRVWLLEELKDKPTDLLLYVMALSKEDKVRKGISVFLTMLRKVKPLLTGKDLIEMGLTPGPLFKEVFDGLVKARILGKVRDRQEEKRWVEDFLRNRKANQSEL